MIFQLYYTMLTLLSESIDHHQQLSIKSSVIQNWYFEAIDSKPASLIWSQKHVDSTETIPVALEQ